ncbi:NAD(P)/FAD-dependent oxidoreductase [Cohnella soli]|uniref:NAD(P)/FAD-dependent oxidoreductase n=1 Tax=Cohnella soli TaxID=425005 RepID=A0ABW0HZP0_9BACL
MGEYGMVIVGAGEAGVRAALELRDQGWKGTITVVGDENQLPYERPPLSKYQLYTEEEQAPVTIAAQEKLNEYGIRLLSGETAVNLDRSSHFIELASGRLIFYERLLLATGARPRQLNVKGGGAKDALYLRKFADAVKLRDRLQPGQHIAIIGGGFIGLEVAASSIRKGCRVTLIEVGPRILMRGVPKEIADRVELLHRNAGVEFKIGNMIEYIVRVGGGYAITLADGSLVESDVVLAGIGAIPETTLAEAGGLDTDNGIKADEYLRTSDPDIFAAGDCCSFPHPLYGGRRIRLEAWRNAQDQGAHVAANMLGGNTPYVGIPWFWSDQYDETLEVTGLTDGSETNVHRNVGSSGQLIFHLAQDGRLVSASGIGSEGTISKDLRLAEKLIAAKAVPNLAELTDPGFKLRELLRSIS